LIAEAGAACKVCSEPSDGGPDCLRCGWPVDGAAAGAGAAAVAAPTPKPKPAPPPPPTPSPSKEYAQTDFASSMPAAGASGGIISNEYAPTQSAAIPSAGRREQTFETQPAAPKPLAKPPTKQPLRGAPPVPLLPAGFFYILKSGLAISFMVGVAIVAGLIFLWQRQAQQPAVAVPRLARHYLSALSVTDYASAYYLLSVAAQARCSMDEFRELRGPGEWKWSDLRLERIERDAAEVSYRWSSAGQEAQTVHLFFLRENDRWVVPFNLGLLKKVEDAMRSNDPDLALLESQEAVRVNPRDPMARAYLCEAAYFRKLYDQAKPECAAALDLAQKYPSSLTPQSVGHLQTLSAAMEKVK
jgi:hypothetical protein